MKFFVDLSKKQLIKSAASNVALERLVLKRRDSLAVEVVFVSRNAVATMPAGTTVSVALKKSFSDSNFLASASGTPPILNLNTVPLEALFSASNPSAITALLEIRWTVPGETTRTATLTAEVQNSVILGTEATPEAIPDGKATQAQAEAGTSNDKWMTPLRTAQAIAVLAPPPTWDAVLNKPATFPPSAHTHTASQITDFAAAVVAAAPPTTNASLLTSGTLADARLSATVTASLAKADTASQPGHGHAISDVSGLQTSLDSKATTTALTAEATLRAAADTALGQRIDFLAANLDPAALDSIAEAAASIGTLTSSISAETQARISGDTALDTKITAEATARTTALSAESQARQSADSALQNALDGKSNTTHGHDIFTRQDEPGGTPGKPGFVPSAPFSAQFLGTTGWTNLPVFTGEPGSGRGIVPTAYEADQSKFLRGDATWALPTTSDIPSERVSFEITGSHPAVEGFYDIWDIELTNGRFRWANTNAAAEGATWTALRWNANRWELGTYTAFTTWTPLYFNTSPALIPPATDWQAAPGNTQPAPTLQWFSQPASVEIAALYARASRLQKQLDDQGGINTAAIQTLSTETAAALTLKADLVNGLVPTTQLPPISFQSTRYNGDGTAFTFAPPGTLTNSDSPSAISVTINGVTQEPGSDYTLNIATNRVVLTSALPLGDKIVITRPILLPSNSTLTAEQLGALTATSVIDGGSF